MKNDYMRDNDKDLLEQNYIRSDNMSEEVNKIDVIKVVDNGDFCKKFYINYKDRTVTCVIKDLLSDSTYDIIDRYAKNYSRHYNYDNMKVSTFTGIAKCRKEDRFDIEVGKKIANYRAEKKHKKAINIELENAIDELRAWADNIAKFGMMKPLEKPKELVNPNDEHSYEFDASMFKKECTLSYENDDTHKITVDNSLYENHRALLNEIQRTYEQKNKAYGNSFGDTFEKLGIISAVTRISDKYNRMCNLAVDKDIDKGDESLRDTLMDMANYCVMTVMELDKDE